MGPSTGRRLILYSIVAAVVVLGITLLVCPQRSQGKHGRNTYQLLVQISRAPADEKQRLLAETADIVSAHLDASAFEKAMNSTNANLRNAALLVLNKSIGFRDGQLSFQRYEGVSTRLRTRGATIETATIAILTSDTSEANRLLASVLLSNCWPESPGVREAARRILREPEGIPYEIVEAMISVLEAQAHVEDSKLLLDLSSNQGGAVSTRARITLAVCYGEKNSLRWLIDVLDHPDPTIRARALRALTQATHLSAENVATTGDSRRDLVPAYGDISNERRKRIDLYWTRYLDRENTDMAAAVKRAWLRWWDDNSEDLQWNKEEKRFERLR